MLYFNKSYNSIYYLIDSSRYLLANENPLTKFSSASNTINSVYI